MNIRRSLSVLAWAALLAAGLTACGAVPAAPGAPAAPPPTAEATAPAAPAATAPEATIVPMPVPTLPIDASTTIPIDATTPIPAVPTVLGGAALNLPQETLGPAVADLAGRLGVALADITIVSAEAVEWSDGSLGCPRPGMMYPQVITEGVRVILGAGGKQYAYHGDTRGALFYCENPSR